MRACEPAAANTNRPAAKPLSPGIGGQSSYGAVGVVHKRAARLKRKDDQRRAAMFEYGEVFEGDVSRGIVVTEMVCMPPGC